MIEKRISEYFRKNVKPDVKRVKEKKDKDAAILKSLL